MSSDPLLLDLGGRVAVLTISRPAKRNAMTLEMWRSFPELLRQASAAAHVRALVIRGQGAHFCAGADVAEFDEIYANRAMALRNHKTFFAAARAVEAMDMPTIAAIEGVCYGGGMTLAMACDLRLASTTAEFCLPPARLGLVYGAGDTRRLVEAVGLGTAKDLTFTGRAMDAGEALMCGLIDRLYQPDHFVGGVQDYLDELTAASRVAASGAKRILRMIAAGVRDDNDASLAIFADAVDAPDFQEGRKAFKEKRKPKF